jgi:hypothetical protein
MAKTLRALFDGKVLRPVQPADLVPNTTYIVTVEREGEGEAEEPYPLAEIGRLATDLGVTDFAERHDWYAHGRLLDEHDG